MKMHHASDVLNRVVNAKGHSNCWPIIARDLKNQMVMPDFHPLSYCEDKEKQPLSRPPLITLFLGIRSLI